MNQPTNTLIRAFARHTHANVAMITGMILPVLLVLCGGALDFIAYTGQRTALQAAADAAALAGAKRFTLAGAQQAQIESYVLNEIDHHMSDMSDTNGYERSVQVTMDENLVVTSITRETRTTLLKSILPPSLTVTSEAIAKGQVKLCALALNENDEETIALHDRAFLEANTCSIFSNSASPTGIVANMKTALTADIICSAGGYVGSTTNYSTTPIVDCPVFADPLAGSLTPPNVGACDYYDYLVGEISLNKEGEVKLTKDDTIKIEAEKNTNYVLHPGVYCGGIRIADKAKITFEPGLYVIKDGPLLINRRSENFGANISIYFTGDDATLFVGRDAQIDFSAAETGALAGVLIMDDPAIATGRAHIIESHNARTLLGTIYTPKATFRIETDKPVADESAYTIIVADKLELLGEPSLFLNSDYAATNVPVPPGVGPIGGTTYLRK